MRIDVYINDEKSERLLLQRPQKDGSTTDYACGVSFHGTWATRLNEHERFCKTTLGEYILMLESHKALIVS